MQHAFSAVHRRPDPGQAIGSPADVWGTVNSRRSEASDERRPSDSVAMVEWTDGWQIQESDYGSVLAFHHHPDGSRVAYVRTDPWGIVEAQCSACGLTYSWHSSEGFEGQKR
jgi:hypothetical protein